MFLEEKLRKDVMNESDQLYNFWVEKIIPLLKKCKQKKEGNLKEVLKLKSLFREHRRRMRKMIGGMKEVNAYQKEVYPRCKDKIFSDIEVGVQIGLYCFYFKQYKELTENLFHQTSTISS